MTSKALSKLFHEDATAEPWWSYVRGASPERERLLRQRKKSQKAAARKAAQQAEAARPVLHVVEPKPVSLTLPLRATYAIALTLLALTAGAWIAGHLDLPNF